MLKPFTLLGIFSYIILSFALSQSQSGQSRQTLYVRGSSLYTPCDDKVVIRGVNKMIIWTDDLNVRQDSYAEIRKTGANCVRIVWLANPEQGENDAGPVGLDRNIQYCIDNDMIPMMELHDATGNWAMLQQMVDYWTKPDIVAVVKKHEKYLLLNIANECGDETVTDEQFSAGYESAITQIRNAGIKCPLVIDASDWGKNLEQLRNVFQYLISKDPESNLLFSAHLYWAISDGADAQFITSEIQQSVAAGLPFIIGEYTYKFNRGAEGCIYETDYKTILQLCGDYQIGWLAWEWGPGNEYGDPTCGIMNMTENSYFNTLKDTWAKELAITSPYSIANTSVTPDYIINGGVCNTQAGKEISEEQTNIEIEPNPFSQNTTISIELNKLSEVSIDIYNALGQLVERICSDIYATGQHKFSIMKSYSDGLYFCRININGKVMTRKIVCAR